MLREIVAAVLILGILGAVILYGVSGLWHIALVLTAGFLSVVLVRGRPASVGKPRS